MGPFHWSKICIAAIGKFLEPSGITDALIKSGEFGKGAAETNVMMGKDYIQGKEGMGVIVEAITLLQYKAFQNNESFDTILGTGEIEQDIENVKDLLYSTEKENLD